MTADRSDRAVTGVRPPNEDTGRAEHMKASWVRGQGPCKGRKSGSACVEWHLNRGWDNLVHGGCRVPDLEVRICCPLAGLRFGRAVGPDAWLELHIAFSQPRTAIRVSNGQAAV